MKNDEESNESDSNQRTQQFNQVPGHYGYPVPPPQVYMPGYPYYPNPYYPMWGNHSGWMQSPHVTLGVEQQCAPFNTGSTEPSRDAGTSGNCHGNQVVLSDDGLKTVNNVTSGPRDANSGSGDISKEYEACASSNSDALHTNTVCDVSDRSHDVDTGPHYVDAASHDTQTASHDARDLNAKSHDAATRSLDDISDDDDVMRFSPHPSAPLLAVLKTDYSSSSSVEEQEPVAIFSPSRNQPSQDGGEGNFEKEVERFVSGRSAMLSRCVSAAPLDLSSVESDEGNFKYAQMEPLEHFMCVTAFARRKKFFQLVESEDIVLARVNFKKSYGVYVQVDSFEGAQKHRYIRDLNIEGFISIKNLGLSSEDKECMLKDLEPDDVVRARVLEVVSSDEKLVLTFRPAPSYSQNLKLGYLEGKCPSSMLRPARRDELLYFLEHDPGFSNPQCVPNLIAVLGIGTTRLPSFKQGLHYAEYPEADYHDNLRKQQRRKWSMENVATGVKHFKAGEHSKAMRYLDHSLEIDGDNVEGLVARGALIANGGKYKEAIRDFEKALTLNSSHSNARKYLAETQAAYGKQLESSGDAKGAVKCYREALADDPTLESPKLRLHVLEQQIARERQKEDEEKQRKKAKLAAKLRKLMKEEEESKKRKKSSNKKSKKQKEKKKKSKDSSSESEADN